MRTELRLFLSAAALGAWLVPLFFGWTFGGLIYLLLPVAVALFPWRDLPKATYRD